MKQQAGTRQKRTGVLRQGGFSLLELVVGMGLLVMLVAVGLASWRSGQNMRAHGAHARQSVAIVPEVRERLAELAPGSVLLVNIEGSGWQMRAFPGRDWLPPAWRDGGRIWGRRRRVLPGGAVRWEVWEERDSGGPQIRLAYYETL